MHDPVTWVALPEPAAGRVTVHDEPDDPGAGCTVTVPPMPCGVPVPVGGSTVTVAVVVSPYSVSVDGANVRCTEVGYFGTCSCAGWASLPDAVSSPPVNVACTASAPGSSRTVHDDESARPIREASGVGEETSGHPAATAGSAGSVDRCRVPFTRPVAGAADAARV